MDWKKYAEIALVVVVVLVIVNHVSPVKSIVNP
jgi:hypothetical protein